MKLITTLILIIFSLYLQAQDWTKMYDNFFECQNNDNYYIVELNGNKGILTYEGEEVLPLKFDEIECVSNFNLFVAHNNNFYYLYHDSILLFKSKFKLKEILPEFKRNYNLHFAKERILIQEENNLGISAIHELFFLNDISNDESFLSLKSVNSEEYQDFHSHVYHDISSFNYFDEFSTMFIRTKTSESYLVNFAATNNQIIKLPFYFEKIEFLNNNIIKGYTKNKTCLYNLETKKISEIQNNFIKINENYFYSVTDSGFTYDEYILSKNTKCIIEKGDIKLPNKLLKKVKNFYYRIYDKDFNRISKLYTYINFDESLINLGVVKVSSSKIKKNIIRETGNNLYFSREYEFFNFKNKTEFKIPSTDYFIDDNYLIFPPDKINYQVFICYSIDKEKNEIITKNPIILDEIDDFPVRVKKNGVWGSVYQNSFQPY